MSHSTRNLLIALTTVVVLVCCCCAVVTVITGGAIFSTILSFANTIVQGPYSISSRPMPADDATDTLLPRSVGAFERQSVSGAPDDGGAVAIYSDGRRQIQVEAEALRSTAQAQQAVDSLQSQYENRGTSRSVGHVNELSYIRFTGSGEARMIWNRGSYTFDVQADDGGALDDFMNDFPY